MISELQLFLDDIKPAILISKTIYYENEEYLKQYNKKELCDDFLVYGNNVDVTQPLGVVLGYYPKCVDLFSKQIKLHGKNKLKKRTISNFINYNGLFFNCYNKFDETLEWCHQQYGQKIINTYGVIMVEKISFTLELEEHGGNIGYVIKNTNKNRFIFNKPVYKQCL